MNIPQLRFKEFTDEWNSIELSKISSDISYGMGLPSKEYDGKNKYIRITDIDDSTNVYSNKDIVSPDGKLEDKYLVRNNDILFARTGASTGKTYLYNEKDGKLYFAGFLIRASIINHNSNFIFQQTKLNKYKRWIKIMSMRSGQPGINSQEYGTYKFSITSKIEEDKISNFLSLLDKKIELQTKKIEDLKLYKLYTTNIIFNSNVILNSKEYELKDILISGSKIPVKDTNLYKKMNIKLNHKGLEINESKREMMDTRPFYIRKEREIIIGKQNYFNGSIAIVNSRFNNCICSNAIMSFSVKKEYDTDYVYNYISQDGYIKRRAFLSNGTGQKELSEKEFLKFTIKVPNKDFQEKTSFIINKFNNKIDLENLKLEELKKLKKGLIQNMFV